MSKKIMALFLSLLMIVSLLTGCTPSNGADERNIGEVVADEDTSTQTTQSDSTTQNATTKSVSTEKKKIVVIMETNDEIRLAGNKNILSTLEKEGYINGKSAEITEIKMNGDEKKSTEIVEQIKQMNPHVVIVNSSQFAFKTVAKPLEGSGIPVVLNLNIENKALDYIDQNGHPKQNITGVYTLPKDLQLNAFNFLEKIAPTNGKKAVFITLEGRFIRADIEKSLNTIGIQLKDYCESKYVEDFQEAVKKYNDDPEVAWMLVGVWPSQKKDGTSISNLEVGKWDIANRKKPSVTYWEAAVKIGMLAGLGVDLPETCTQSAEMAVKILNGEDVKDIVAINPRKINIVLNQQRAKDLGIEFSAETLASAYRIYKDYNGTY